MRSAMQVGTWLTVPQVLLWLVLTPVGQPVPQGRFAMKRRVGGGSHRTILSPSDWWRRARRAAGRAARHWLELTVLQLSRGWQIRDPLQLRRDELV